MANLVSPKVYFVGFTTVNPPEIERYLRDTGQEDFLDDWQKATAEGVPGGLTLCSMFAKLCYKSLVVGKNANVQKTRGVRKNLEGCFDTGHGSVFEHCNLSFLVTDCSRVYTHEQVRHRSGFAYSQTSGRYCRLDNIDLVWDSVLDSVKELFLNHVKDTEDLVYAAECRLGLRKPNPLAPNAASDDWIRLRDTAHRWVPDDTFDFEKRKKITSAIRRIAPNGQANEIGITCNVRSLRHVVQLRTARFAETEIRNIWNQIYQLVRKDWKVVFHGARERVHDGLPEIYGMRQQPYDTIEPEVVS